MIKETIQYFCDNKNCGKEIADIKDSVAIEVGYSFGEAWISLHRSGTIRKHVCKDCAENLGIIRKVVKNDNIIPEVKSTADQLYDVLSQLVWENTPGQG